MAPLGIIDALAAPRIDHTGEHIRKFRTADTRLGENLGVVAADMFDHPQRLSGGSIDQPVFRLAGDLLAQVENDVRSVGQAFRLAELAAGSLIKVFARLFLLLGNSSQVASISV